MQIKEGIMYKKSTQIIKFIIIVGILPAVSLQAIPYPPIDTSIIEPHLIQEFTDNVVQDDIARTTRYHSYSKDAIQTLEKHKAYQGSAFALCSLGCLASGIATTGFGLKSLGHTVRAASLPSTGNAYIDQSSFINTAATIIGGLVTYYTYGMVKNAWKKLKNANLLIGQRIQIKDLPQNNALIQRQVLNFPGLVWFRIGQEEKVNK